jgi:Na+:H+ antiporter, NhaA family
LNDDNERSSRLGGDPDDEVPNLKVSYSRSDRRIPRQVLRPLQAFLSTERAGGMVLLAAALLALGWANSPWAQSYEQVWHTRLAVQLGPWSLGADLRHWINDGLMTVFFLVVGLEIKRELVNGELRERRKAALPVVGALGGMLLPAVLYALLTTGTAGFRGWGIPMATDIAFAVGVLSLMGSRAPASMRLFLLALAIVDDIGAIVVIATFYSGPVSFPALGAAATLLLLMTALQKKHVRSNFVYILLGLGVWLAISTSGVHPAIAGVALGLITPTVQFQRPRAVSEEAHRIADATVDDPVPPDVDAHHWQRLAKLSHQTVPPLTRLEDMLHPFTSFAVLPLFALANAGVDLRGMSVPGTLSDPISLAVILGLVVGKMAGITVAAWIGIRLGLASLPDDVSWPQLLAVASLGGIGFTVSLFIASLAFQDPASLASAKVGILAGSTLAGCLGAGLLFRLRRPRT